MQLRQMSGAGIRQGTPFIHLPSERPCVRIRDATLLKKRCTMRIVPPPGWRGKLTEAGEFRATIGRTQAHFEGIRAKFGRSRSSAG